MGRRPGLRVARPSYALRERWTDAARRLGGLRSFSDRVADLDPWGLAAVRDLVAAGSRTEPFTAAELAGAAALAESAR